MLFALTLGACSSAKDTPVSGGPGAQTGTTNATASDAAAPGTTASPAPRTAAGAPGQAQAQSSGASAAASSNRPAAPSQPSSSGAPAEPMMTALSACGEAKPNLTVGNACPGTPPPALKLTEIASGFLSPTYVTQAPNDPSRLYVLEQQGTIRVVKDGKLQSEPFADLRDLKGAQVNNATILPTYGEGGLLGAVFDPRFSETKRLWISYTKPGPAFTVGQFTVSDPDKLDVLQYQELLTFKQYGFFQGSEATNHVGSMLAFGPDGCLYVSRGDGGGEMDRQMSGQKTSDDLCSLLRIDVDRYPTPAAGNLDGHVWNFGLRNPWRYSFDRERGDLYIGDVGQDVGTGFEEVNIEPRGVSGRNYGWSIAQGSKVCDGDCSKMTTPAYEYAITDTQNSVIGGYVYRGKQIPGLVGRYVFADWTERKIKTLVYKGDNNGQAEICDVFDTPLIVPTKVRSFGEGTDGELYLVAAGAPTSGLSSAGIMEAGTLYRLDPAEGASGATNGAAGSAAPGGMTSSGTAGRGSMGAATGAATFSAIYDEILTRGATGNCMFGACHGGMPDPTVNGGLQIKAADKAGTYQHLVNAKSVSQVCNGKTYVVPGDSKNSLLIAKLSDMPPCGARMPIGNPLTAAQIAQISTWIDMGAKDD
jgi:glucose/arabinose dehydrogenase